jgi:hypothetical protein
MWSQSRGADASGVRQETSTGRRNLGWKQRPTAHGRARVASSKPKLELSGGGREDQALARYHVSWRRKWQHPLFGRGLRPIYTRIL